MTTFDGSDFRGQNIEDSRLGLLFRVRDLARRVELLEEAKPEVVAFEVRTLRSDFNALKRSFYAFAFSVVGGSLLFALTAFRFFGGS